MAGLESLGGYMPFPHTLPCAALLFGCSLVISNDLSQDEVFRLATSLGNLGLEPSAVYEWERTANQDG